MEKNIKFVDISGGRENNLDIIRLTAAFLVMYAHAFILSTGSREGDLIYRFSEGGWDGGTLAVAIFFVISGYLITQSYCNSKTGIAGYFKNRCLRIFPALIAVVFCTVFIAGPLLTNLTASEYFHNAYSWSYLKNIFLLPVQFVLPGVFTGNIYPDSVNGALWTLSYEFLMYVIVAVLGKAGVFLRRRVSLLLFAALMILECGKGRLFENRGILRYFTLYDFIRLSLFFIAGMTFYLYRDKIVYSLKIALAAVLILFAGRTQAAAVIPLFAVCGTYIIFYLGFHQKIKLMNVSKHGDFSYGLYIWGFLVQQTVIHVFGGSMNPYVNLMIAFAVSLGLAVISWNLVEKKALRWKSKTFHIPFYQKKETKESAMMTSNEDGVTAKEKGIRNRNIDMIRACAIMIILIYHFRGLAGGLAIQSEVINHVVNFGGEIGVTLFFLLSGFGIYQSLNYMAGSQGKIAYRAYFKKRLVRIVPQYYISIVILLLLSSGAVYCSRAGIGAVLTHFLFVHNLFADYHGAINGVLWTMGVIFQFYLIAPILFRWIKKNKWLTLILSLLFTIGVKAFVFHTILEPKGLDGVYYFIYGRQLYTALDNFVIGMILAEILNSLNENRKNGRRIMELLFALTAVVCWICVGGRYGIYFDGWLAYVWHTAAAALLGIGVFCFASLKINTNHFLSKILLWISKYEYGIYIWHLVIANNLIAQSSFFQNSAANRPRFFIVILIIISLGAGYFSTKAFDHIKLK